ncbi:hypothetical protein DGMP_03550 [Desulfomarina profundi]|uniref:6-phosphofructokinase n=1 Tax=Desulfomarina profundi TaxID=2772557 RepID=A0A8D5JKL2_9BACT|nr:hypothetical protein DGMP_03550 [Desulfomarina profundi]
MKKIVISTGGGDAPGLNAVIYSVVHTCYRKGWEVYGSKSGYAGFLDFDEMIRLTLKDVEGIYSTGGTILGSTNKGNPFRRPVENLAGEIQIVDISDKILRNFERMGFDCHIAIGGDGSLEIAHRFAEKGMPVIGVPKTIDNDLEMTNRTFGFDTAVSTATDALDKLHSTAKSHDRVLVVEVMGRDSGWIALYSGISGGADVILIPEIPFDMEEVCNKITDNELHDKHYSIVVVAEGAITKDGKVFNKGQGRLDGTRLFSVVWVNGLPLKSANELKKIHVPWSWDICSGVGPLRHLIVCLHSVLVLLQFVLLRRRFSIIWLL